MTKALIFGINGQDGHYLQSILQKQNHEVIGVSRSNPTNNSWIQGNVADQKLVTDLIKQSQPEYIFHLAAHSSTLHELLAEHQGTIVNGSLNILNAVSQFSPSTKVFITGSGLQFVNNEKPISEKDAFAGTNPYSLARIQSAFIARYFRSRGIKTYIGYLFHHDSPYRTAKHLNRQIIEGVKRVKKGEPANLFIGDINVEKEFGYAADIAEGIFKLIRQEQYFEAAIGTGISYKVSDWLRTCFSLINEDWEKHTKVNNEFKPDFRKMVSDPTTMEKIGWKAKTQIEELAQLMLNT